MTIEDLKINPTFRDLIPKLTQSEYAQLEKNILEDGRVKEPIIVWNKFIIDGHHRYYIIKNYPEIPYKIEEKEFANEYAAMAWACANQLGRRNLTEYDAVYLEGKKYESQKAAETFHGNQYTLANESGDSKTGTTKSSGSVAKRMAKEDHIGVGSVIRSEQFSKGVDIAEEIVPGIKDRILRGDVNVSKSVVQKISKTTPDKQRKATIAISDGQTLKAKNILNDKTLSKYGLNDTDDNEPFALEDLLQELSASFNKCIDGLKTTIFEHADILHGDEADQLRKDLSDLFREKIEEFMEGL